MDSYEHHPAGADHQLVVIFKGFPEQVVPDRFSERLQPHGARRFLFEDSGFDLNSYWAAARLLDHEVLGFLNSFSVILADDWLSKLAGALQPPVGLVGATGSWESLQNPSGSVTRSGVLLAPWRAAPPPLPARRLSVRDRAWLVRQYLAGRSVHVGFPNPHVRSNAFLVRREVMLRFDPGPLASKEDAYRFESGRSGLTRRIQRMGLQVRVVGRDGVAYPPADWSRSGTFRVGDQGNLLVADNRTEDWLALPPERKAELAALTWGRPTDRRVERMR